MDVLLLYSGSDTYNSSLVTKSHVTPSTASGMEMWAVEGVLGAQHCL